VCATFWMILKCKTQNSHRSCATLKESLGFVLYRTGRRQNTGPPVASLEGRTRARALLDTFPNHELVRSIYETAQKMAGEDANLYHQMGIYEMIRPNGNLSVSQKHLLKAQELHPRSIHIKHSMAEYHIHVADNARTELEKLKHLDEAVNLCAELKRQEVGESYAHHTLVKVGIRRLRALFEAPERNSLPSEFEDVIKQTEGTCPTASSSSREIPISSRPSRNWQNSSTRRRGR